MERKLVCFGFLDHLAEIEITEHNRPHWFQPGAAIFVTFRLADSLPREVVARYQAELVDWCQRNRCDIDLAESFLKPRTPGLKRKLDALSQVQRAEHYRLVNRLRNRALDESHGACLLKSVGNAQIVAEAILKFDGSRYDVDCFVIMPNHVHAICQFREGYDLKIVSQSWMRFTARQINSRMSLNGKVWQSEPFDHIIRSPAQFDYLRKYVLENPKKARLVDGEFLYWCR